MSKQDLLDRNGNNFAYHPLKNEDAGELLDSIRSRFLILANDLVRDCPDSRELSLSLTKLEEAMFWSVASVARKVD